MGLHSWGGAPYAGMVANLEVAARIGTHLNYDTNNLMPADNTMTDCVDQAITTVNRHPIPSGLEAHSQSAAQNSI